MGCFECDLGIVWYHKPYKNIGLYKDKDKEALFNVAYNVTDNISSWAILRHNIYIFNRYLPVFISLAQPLLCERQQGSC